MGLRRVLLLVCLLTVCHCALAQPRQTRPWRIAVGGAFTTGYLGLLAMHGLPRERLSEQDLLDLNKLRQYSMVFLGLRGYGGGQINTVIEDYVRQGGIAVVDSGYMPSESAVPGRRIGPAAHPNIRFVDSGTPLTAGLPERGIVQCMSGYGMSIIPTPGSNVVVLANYTDEEAPPRNRGIFVANGKGTPAIMVATLGQGKLIFSGISITFNLSLRGQALEPLICNILRTFSNGELADRMSGESLERDELVTVPPLERESPAYPAPAGAAVAPPSGYEVLAEAPDLTDFAITAKLPASQKARVLISYWSPTLYRELIFQPGKVILQRQNGKDCVRVASAALPEGSLDLVIMRRFGRLVLEANHKQVLAACDGPAQQGALAVQGLTEPAYQPLDQVYFSDDFMRESSTEDEWERVQGTWQIMAAEGKPDMGANPFDYVGTAQERALALNGAWFWSDYGFDAAVKCSGRAAGIIANYRDADDWLALRLSFEKQPAHLQLIRHQDGKDAILAESEVPSATQDWHRLGLRTSGGTLLGLLDGQLKLQAIRPDSLCGQVGLFCERGQANFDDITIRPWTASTRPTAQELLVTGGSWKQEGELLVATGANGARAFPAWSGSGDQYAEVEVKADGAAASGLHLRYARANVYYLVALMNEKGKLKLRVYRHGNPGLVLAEKAVPGSANQWHKLAAEVQGGRILTWLDGQPVLHVLDPGHREGLVGLYMRGSQSAAFRNFRAWQPEPTEQLVDELTPKFAGIIDRHTWAGRSGAWTPDPEDLGCFWHHGFLPGDVNFQVGVHPSAGGRTIANLYLSRPRAKREGYGLVVDRNWASRSVPIKLLRRGEVVVETEAAVTPAQAFAVGLVRHGTQLMIEVNGVGVRSYWDPNPLPGLYCLGLEQTGSLIQPDDVSVSSPDVHDYTFETAPTDWAVQSGLWEITSRWSCTPGWAWFSGQNATGYAIISTKAAYTGDQDVVMYVGPKMMPAGEKRFSEKFGDVYITICSGGAAAPGYQLALGGADSSSSVLRRNGQVVATSNYRLPSSNFHNDWLRLMVCKRGGKITVWAWDALVLEYTDPQPLVSGRISLGTSMNGIIVPRVSVFGKRL